MSNRLNQAAQRRIIDAVACHQKPHQGVVKELGQAQLGKVHMHGDPPLAWRHSRLALESPRPPWWFRLGLSWQREIRRRDRWTDVHSPTGLALLDHRGPPLGLN